MKKKILGIFVCMLLISVAVLPIAGTFNIKTNSVESSSDVTDWWSMFHHDLNNSGYSTSNAPNTNNVLWSYNTGYDVRSSPAVVDGKVYINSYDGHMFCLDSNTGGYI